MSLKVQNSEEVQFLVDSGAELSLITKQLGEDLGYPKAQGEINNQAEGVGGSIEYLLRQIKIQLDGHIFPAPVPWAQTDFCQEIVLGREVVFDLFDIGFKQAEEPSSVLNYKLHKLGFESSAQGKARSTFVVYPIARVGRSIECDRLPV